MKAKELNTNTNQFRLDKLKRNKTGNKKPEQRTNDQNLYLLLRWNRKRS